ncbi:MAG TPA: sigma-70 family RNA polymerase sigma factor [Steroidobacteraceae bacterium]|nr:sigma-70 family RNA polymerase sigma factor [Steroidobacteraceae bacterium]
MSESDSEASDATLLSRYAAGEVAAFESLYRRHELRLWRYLERHLGERALAEELMQEVWFTVAREAGRYRPTARFTTWLFTLAHHRLIDAVRARRPHVSLDALEEDRAWLPQLATEPAAGPLAAAVARDRAQALRRALGQLPLEQRDAFLLHLEGELAVEEVASVTGCNAETAKSRLRYARTKLRELLKEHA